MNEIDLISSLVDHVKEATKEIRLQKKTDNGVVTAPIQVLPFSLSTVEAMKSACPFILVEPMNGDVLQEEFNDYASALTQVRMIVGVFYSEHDAAEDKKYRRLGIDKQDIGQFMLVNVLVRLKEHLLMHRFLDDRYEMMLDDRHKMQWDAVPNNINTAPYAFGIVTAWYRGTDPIEIEYLDI